MELWPGGAPGAKGTDPDKDVPSITVWLPRPELATGSAVVVCPGGGYGMLAVEHEGKQVAEWLNGLGIAAFVLKYRLGPRYHHPAMLDDAGRAIRTVRANAAKWKVDPGRVAIMGFSAGGHLASTAGTHFSAGKPDADDPVERQSSRPDRLILVYPVIALATPFGHTRLPAKPAGRKPLARADRKPFERAPGDQGHPADLPGPHQRRHRSARREQHSLCTGVAKSRRSGRAASLRARPARPRPGLGSAAVPSPAGALVPGLAEAVRNLAQEPGLSRQEMTDCPPAAGPAASQWRTIAC